MSCEKSDDIVFKTGLIKAEATLTGAAIGGILGGPSCASIGAGIVGKLGSCCLSNITALVHFVRILEYL